MHAYRELDALCIWDETGKAWPGASTRNRGQDAYAGHLARSDGHGDWSSTIDLVCKERPLSSCLALSEWLGISIVSFPSGTYQNCLLIMCFLAPSWTWTNLILASTHTSHLPTRLRLGFTWPRTTLQGLRSSTDSIQLWTWSLGTRLRPSSNGSALAKSTLDLSVCRFLLRQY